MDTSNQEITQQTTEDQALNREVIKNPNEEVVELETPILMGNNQITFVTVRKPNVQALSGVSIQQLYNYETDALVKVLPRVTTPALTAHQVKSLDVVDLIQLGGQVVNFLYPKAVQEALKEEMEKLA